MEGVGPPSVIEKPGLPVYSAIMTVIRSTLLRPVAMRRAEQLGPPLLSRAAAGLLSVDRRAEEPVTGFQPPPTAGSRAPVARACYPAIPGLLRGPMVPLRS